MYCEVENRVEHTLLVSLNTSLSSFFDISTAWLSILPCWKRRCTTLDLSTSVLTNSLEWPVFPLKTSQNARLRKWGASHTTLNSSSDSWSKMETRVATNPAVLYAPSQTVPIHAPFTTSLGINEYALRISLYKLHANSSNSPPDTSPSCPVHCKLLEHWLQSCLVFLQSLGTA